MKAEIRECIGSTPDLVLKLHHNTEIVTCDEIADAINSCVDADEVSVCCDAEDLGEFDKCWDVTLNYRGFEYNTWFSTIDVAYLSRDGMVACSMYK